MSRLSNALLFRFAPRAGDDDGAVAPPPDPVPRLTLALTTKLLGKLRSAATRDGLWAELLIRFAPAIEDLCARIRLLGVSPGRHARLSLPLPVFNDSTCGYVSPATSPPLTVYLDADADADPGGWTLQIHFPNRNWYPYFDWPGAHYMADPPFREDEQRPPRRLELQAFSSPVSRWVENEDGELVVENIGGVRLPMKLVLDPGQSRPYRVIKDLTYDDSPVLTGGPRTVALQDEGPLFIVTMREVADALDGLTDAYGSDDREGQYDLKWIVYDSDGDMTWEAFCCNGGSLGTCTERQSGVSGIFETGVRAVAEVAAVPAPLAFWRGDGVTFAADRARPASAAARAVLGASGGRYWRGTHRGGAVALTWSGSFSGREIFLAERRIGQPGGRVLAAALRDGDPPVLCWIELITSGALAGALFLVRETLRLDNPAVRYDRLDTAAFFDGHTGSGLTFQFSPDARAVACHEPPSVADDYFGGLLLLTIPDSLADAPTGFSRSTPLDNSLQAAEWTEDNGEQNGSITVKHVTRDVSVIYGYRWNGATAAPLVGALHYARVEREEEHQWAYQTWTSPNGTFFERTLVPDQEGISKDLVEIEVTLNGQELFFTKFDRHSNQRSTSVHPANIETYYGPQTRILYENRIQARVLGGTRHGHAVEGLASAIDQSYEYWAASQAAAAEVAVTDETTLSVDGEVALTYTNSRPLAPAFEIVQTSIGTMVFVTGTYYEAELPNNGGYIVSGQPLGWSTIQDPVMTAPGVYNLRPLIYEIFDLNRWFDAVDSADGQSRYAATRAGALNLFGAWFDARYAVDGAAAAVIVNDKVLPASMAGCLYTPEWSEIPTWSMPDLPTAADVLTAINAARARADPPAAPAERHALVMNEALCRAAGLHLAWMTETGALGAAGRDDSTPLDRARASGYPADDVDEIEADDRLMTADAYLSLLEGEGGDRWESVLDPRWRDFGACVWPAGPELQSYVWCLLFGVAAETSP